MRFFHLISRTKKKRAPDGLLFAFPRGRRACVSSFAGHICVPRWVHRLSFVVHAAPISGPQTLAHGQSTQRTTFADQTKTLFFWVGERLALLWSGLSVRAVRVFV